MRLVNFASVRFINRVIHVLCLGVATSLLFVRFAQSTEIVTLQLNSSQSWIRDTDWFEIFSDAQGATPSLYYGVAPFGYELPKGAYHTGQTVALSGTIKLALGGAYALAIELFDSNVNTSMLPSGHSVDLKIGPLTLRNGVFPNDSFTLPEGSFCACISLVDPYAPKINGSFDGHSLVLDALFPSNIFMLLPIAEWLGDPPHSDGIEVSRPKFHLEATVVPVPPAAGLFTCAFGVLFARFRRQTRSLLNVSSHDRIP